MLQKKRLAKAQITTVKAQDEKTKGRRSAAKSARKKESRPHTQGNARRTAAGRTGRADYQERSERGRSTQYDLRTPEGLDAQDYEMINSQFTLDRRNKVVGLDGFETDRVN